MRNLEILIKIDSLDRIFGDKNEHKIFSYLD